MAYKATLKLDAAEYDVLTCSYAFNRDIDNKGKPSSIIYGGTVQLYVEATSDTSIVEAMVNNTAKPVDGSVTWKNPTTDSTMKVLEFKSGFIVDYTESFSNSGGDAMSISFTISAKELSVGSAEHINEWPKQ